MNFIVYITSFLVLVAVFFLGMIVGFQMGRQQEREDADKLSTHNGVKSWRDAHKPYDQGPAKNSPEREDAICRKLSQSPQEEAKRLADERRNEDRLRYEREQRN